MRVSVWEGVGMRECMGVGEWKYEMEAATKTSTASHARSCKHVQACTQTMVAHANTYKHARRLRSLARAASMQTYTSASAGVQAYSAPTSTHASSHLRALARLQGFGYCTQVCHTYDVHDAHVWWIAIGRTKACEADSEFRKAMYLMGSYRPE
eukprot:1921541-Pleurochrysis_carterae.AAC.1